MAEKPTIDIKGLGEGDRLTYMADGKYFDLSVLAVDEDRHLPVVEVTARSDDPAESLNVERINQQGLTGILLGSSALYLQGADVVTRDGQLAAHEFPILEMIVDGEIAPSLLPTLQTRPSIQRAE